MKIPLKALLLLSALLTLNRSSSRAEVVVTVNHNEESMSTEPFQFQEVASPRPTAALSAVFKLVDGEVVGDIASLNLLHDGQLPEEDQPDANFFFQDGTDGGRLLVDLGKVIPVREVNTYSRNPNVRGMQVYRLYGSDGSGTGFVPEPKRPQDPAQAGWKLLASVDTRTRFGQEGGQYGVSVADKAGPLGNYRYLLFDVVRTESDDETGNTFFSEINVAEAVWMGVAVEPVSRALRTQLSLEPAGGLVLGQVVADGPAAKAGLQADDVLTRLDDQAIIDPAQFVTLVQSRHVGETVRVSYVRHAQPGVAQVELGVDPRPASNETPVAAARDQITVTVDHNEGAEATKAFKFKTVPSPRPNAASGASFSLKEGDEADSNSGSPDVLHDGELPDSEDQPEANFFFQAGSKGGGLMIDLGKVIAIKEVNTYSWHADTRAPQVYKLYGCESSDDAKGWKLITDVDTRTQFGAAGGQYGVRVAAGDGIVGRYRYLCFYMARTEDADDFGNTFYSEINVVEGDASAKPAAPAAAPAKGVSRYDREGMHLTFTDNSASFDPKEKERLVDTFFAVYPKMAAEFNHDAPREAKIILDPNYRGVAQAEDDTIRCSPAWFRDHPEDLDVLTHEGMHVVQHYRQWEPTWIVEGIADYARAKFGVNNAASGWTMPEFDAKQSYKDAYRVTARFFVWLEKHVKPGIVVSLDQSMREAKYTPEFWKQQAGKSVDELWQDYGKNPAL